MPTPEPAADADFPIYSVRAVCPTEGCGRKGTTKALRPYPEGTVISTPCRECIDRWEAHVERLSRRPLEIVKAKRAKGAEREHKPLERTPHWTEKLQ